jgi:hypothetical protein
MRTTFIAKMHDTGVNIIWNFPNDTMAMIASTAKRLRPQIRVTYPLIGRAHSSWLALGFHCDIEDLMRRIPKFRAAVPLLPNPFPLQVRKDWANISPPINAKVYATLVHKVSLHN